MDEQINNYFKGELSFNERLELLRKTQIDPELKRVFMQQQNLEALLSMNHQQDDHEEGVNNYDKFLTFRKQSIFRKAVVKYSCYAAAVLILLICGWTGAKYDDTGSPDIQNKLYVPSGQRACLTLNDGTEVWLNAGSTLFYPVKFKEKERKVTLIGEAFFKVAKDTSKPFIVKTRSVDIKVLGTKFNVYSYPQSDYICTSLIEGSVIVYEPGKEKHSVTLKPNEQVYYKNGIMQIKQIKNPKDFSWKDGIYNFENEPFGNIAKKLEVYYDVNIQISDTSLWNREYTGKFRQLDGVDEILRIIQKIHKFKINKNRESNTITISK